MAFALASKRKNHPMPFFAYKFHFLTDLNVFCSKKRKEHNFYSFFRTKIAFQARL